jgi:hypothetical protein
MSKGIGITRIAILKVYIPEMIGSTRPEKLMIICRGQLLFQGIDYF